MKSIVESYFNNNNNIVDNTNIVCLFINILAGTASKSQTIKVKRGPIFSQAEKELGTSFIMTVFYASCLAENELVSSLAKKYAPELMT